MDKRRPRRPRSPSPAKTARTRATIVTAALDIFLDRGFSGTRMDDVAERAGVGKGTLYLYFRTKHSLFAGIVEEMMGRTLASFNFTQPEPQESARSFIERTLQPFVSGLESSRRADVMRLVIAEGTRFPELAETYRRITLEPLARLIRRLAKLAIARGELQSKALARFPLLLVTPALLAAVWNGLYGAETPLDPGQLFTAYLELIFNADNSTRNEDQVKGRGG
ncbi:MAG: TetR/AcrR family transcriptional regulator [Verrucomicrobia bacterium]|nr:TetR/AcrR family transcriptional regulator [Verrucomicrobiota bacterium]